MKNLLADCSVIVEVPVLWGQMDAFGHVNNTVYFQYFEEVRVACFEQLGILKLKESTGIAPILASTQCRFRIPLTYPDTVSIGTRISKVQEDRFVMEYIVVSHRAEKVAAEGDGVLVTFDYRAGRKVPVPPELRQRILELEENSSPASGR